MAAASRKAPPKLVTLEEKKKWVRIHESKMDDLIQALPDEPNKAEKKKMEQALAVLRKDEFYPKIVAEIMEMELETTKDAERAQVAAPKAGAKAGAKASAEAPAPAAAGAKAGAKALVGKAAGKAVAA